MKQSFWTFFLFLIPLLVFSIYRLSSLYPLFLEIEETGIIVQIIQIFMGMGAAIFIITIIISLILAIPFLFLSSYIFKLVLRWFGHDFNYKKIFNIFAFSGISI
jgi:hypothetical protein